MTFSTGLRFFALALIISVIAPANAQTQLTPEFKQKLAAAAAAAKPVSVKEAPPASEKIPTKTIDAIDESELQDLEPIPPAPAQDANEIEPLRLSLDKPEIIRLDRDAINVIVGSNENLRVVPDTNRNLVLIAKSPGSTYFRALDADGKVIMQRHVIIGSPTKNYIRIRRACANGTSSCKQYSVYYCPDMCHEVNVVQGTSGPSADIPSETPAGASASRSGGSAESAPEMETPRTEEPPPGE